MKLNKIIHSFSERVIKIIFDFVPFECVVHEHPVLKQDLSDRMFSVSMSNISIVSDYKSENV